MDRDDTIRVTPEFTWSDAWLLLSIAVADAGNGASLKAILAAGDWMNHAIFTGPELRRGLARLLHVAYISTSEGRFSLAGKAQAFWKTCQRNHISVMARMKDFEGFLGVVGKPSEDPLFEDPEWPFPGMTDEKVHQAYQEYIGESRSMKKKGGKS